MDLTFVGWKISHFSQLSLKLPSIFIVQESNNVALGMTGLASSWSSDSVCWFPFFCPLLIRICFKFFHFYVFSFRLCFFPRANTARWRERKRALGRWDALTLQSAKQHQRGPPETWTSNACPTCTQRGSGPSWPGRGGHRCSLLFISKSTLISCNYWPPGRLVWGSPSANQWALIHSVHST